MTNEHTVTQTLYTGFQFIESPRWYNDQLWFVDMNAHQVLRASLGSEPEVVCTLDDDYPSGLGWVPDGRLLLVAMESRQVRRLEADGSLVVHADVSALATGDINDMVVRSDGTAWLGDMAYKVHSDNYPTEPGHSIRVNADGSAGLAASDLFAPNGHAILADGKTLIVAESGGSRLFAFDIASNGALLNRRVFAELVPEAGNDYAPPDGICVDAEGAVWFADPMGRRVSRVLKSGEVTDTVRLADGAAPIACALGGPQRQTLFIAVASALPGAGELAPGNARIDAISVAVGGAGSP